VATFKQLATDNVEQWLLGYPEAALRDADDALRNAREIGQAATLMYALCIAAVPYTAGLDP
jgi:hypothetical protein